MKPYLTKEPMKDVVIFITNKQDAKLLRLAASQERISRSELMRQALREKVSRVLTGVSDHLADQRGSASTYVKTKKSPQ